VAFSWSRQAGSVEPQGRDSWLVFLVVLVFLVFLVGVPGFGSPGAGGGDVPAVPGTGAWRGPVRARAGSGPGQRDPGS
jgi:hypothetical protein